MIYPSMILTESRTMVTVTFLDCNCQFSFDKGNLAEGKMTMQITYCTKYPRCEKALTAVFSQARARLMAEASEATLVIPDEVSDEMLGMDWTGMV